MKGKKRVIQFYNKVAYLNPPLAGSNPSLRCTGSTYTLNAICPNVGTILWGNGQAGTSISFTPTLANKSISVFCTEEGCLSDATELKFGIKYTPILTASNYELLDTPTTLTVSGCTGATIYWADDIIGTYFNQSTRIVTPTVSTTYEVECYDSANYNCTTTAQVTIPSPCPPQILSNSLPLSYSIIDGIIQKKSIGSITATNRVTNNANVTYQGGTFVLLNPGFKADNGSVFKAQLGGCN